MKDRKLTSRELHRAAPEEYPSLPGPGIAVVLDNVRSAYNTGSAFRSSDAFKADLIALCGITAVPPSAEIHKSAIGAEDSVPFIYGKDTLEVIGKLRAEGHVPISVEQTVNSVKLDDFVPQKGTKYALVFGNEVDGVAQEVVDACDFSLEIPQFGTKHSLNVATSIGIVLWHFSMHLRKV